MLSSTLSSSDLSIGDYLWVHGSPIPDDPSRGLSPVVPLYMSEIHSSFKMKVDGK